MSNKLLPCISRESHQRQGIQPKVMIKTIRRRNKHISMNTDILSHRDKGRDIRLLIKETKKPKIYLKQDKENKKNNDLLIDKLFKDLDNNKSKENQNSNRTKADCDQLICTPRTKPKLLTQSLRSKRDKEMEREKVIYEEDLKVIEQFDTSFGNDTDTKDIDMIYLATLYSEINHNHRHKCLTPIISLSTSSNKTNITKREFSFASESKNGLDIHTNIKKTNQDRLITLSHILKLNQFNCFGVLDGHGQNGHFIAELASQYISNYFIDSLKYYISRNEFNKGKISSLKGILNESEIYSRLSNKNYSMIKTCIKETQTKINESEYEIDFSGCTCCCVLQAGHHLICVNIGDSRAILIKSSKEIIQLSNDHKPSAAHERRRIEECGGEVKRMSNNAGPERVWVKNQKYPGIAMSRSLGDKIAKAIGVSYEPDILDYTLDDNKDQYVVIASDGLWDYVSNEQVEKIVSPCYMNNDSKLAVKLLIEASSAAHIKSNTNIDDISIIVGFFPLSIK